MRALACLVALTACWSEPPPVAPRPPPPTLHPASPLVPSLVAVPAKLTMAERAAFRLRWRVYNDGRETVDTKLAGGSRLLINGAASNSWNNAVLNGAVDPDWDALRPGKEITVDYPFGEGFFPAPGDYTLVLELEHAASKPIHVHVDP